MVNRTLAASPAASEVCRCKSAARFVQIAVLWAAAGILSAYEDKVLRLVTEHGGRVLERGTVQPGSQHDGEPASADFICGSPW